MRFYCVLFLLIGMGIGFYFGNSQDSNLDNPSEEADRSLKSQSEASKLVENRTNRSSHPSQVIQDNIKSRLGAGVDARMDPQENSFQATREQSIGLAEQDVVAISKLNLAQREFLDALPYQVVEHYSREKAKELAERMRDIAREMQDESGRAEARARLATYHERNDRNQALESRHLFSIDGKPFEMKFTYLYDADLPESKVRMQIDKVGGTIQDRLYYPDIRSTQMVDGRVYFTVPINLISDASAYRYALIELPEFEYSADSQLRLLEVNSNTWLEKQLNWVEARAE